MERVFGSFYENEPYSGPPLPDNTALLRENGVVGDSSEEAQHKAREFRQRLSAGEHLLLVGLNIGHNAGIALLEASSRDGIVVHANFEEERFTAIKHFAGYPEHSVQALLTLLHKLGKTPADLFCVVYAWDSVQEEQYGLRMNMFRDKIIKNSYYAHVSSAATPQLDKIKVASVKRKNLYSHSPTLIDVVKRLNEDLRREAALLCVQALHHDNHAYYSYGVSPFFKGAADRKVTMISCIDGGGDASATSLYKATGEQIELIKRGSRENSLGVFYMLCSSFLGGWAPLSSEGRYMGAAAWGNGDRLTNPVYKRLRQFFYFGPQGEVFVNSAMTHDECRELQNIVGPFLPVDGLWNPDAVLNVDDITHAKVTQERVDKAAAVQMVFEDALFHIIAHLIEETRSDQLVLCGGTALNCVANMRLLQHFDRAYYQRYLGQDTQLHIWVPPIPSDQGVVVGAPFQFAMRNGAVPRRMATPFLCGPKPTTREIEAALQSGEQLLTDRLGNIHEAQTRQSVADWMAYLVANNAVIGIFQGEAETGPRALGNRSLLSNPRSVDTLALLNDRVKLRERVRPLAPMVTRESAAKWFELSEGASDGDYDAYNYMVLTAPATEEGRKTVPAVVHHDGTSRIQIVRPENNPLMYDYLKALGRRIGVEVSVNTSLNVGSPIVQTPAQAVEIFKRARGLDGIFMVAEDGEAFMVWAKDGVQKYDSNLPRICRSYCLSEAAPALKMRFVNALEVKRVPAEALTGSGELISIKAGAGTPWIGVPGLTGNPGDDMPLFKALAQRNPVFGLQSAREGASVTEIAAQYANVIRRSFAEGPYWLAGYSHGGVLAFEIARLLQAAQPHAELQLLLVDTPFPGAEGITPNQKLPHQADCLAFAAESMLRYQTGAEHLQMEPLPAGARHEQAISAMARLLVQRGVTLPLAVIERKLARTSQWCQQLSAAFESFRVKPLSNPTNVCLYYVQTYRVDEPGSLEARSHADRWLHETSKNRLHKIPTDNARHSLFSLLAQSRLRDMLDASLTVSCGTRCAI